MNHMRMIAALFSAVPLALAATFASAADMEVEATIQSVDVPDRSITVKIEETDTMQTFRVGDDTEVSFTAELQSGAAPLRSDFGDLRAGQEVTLRFDEEEMDGDWVLLHLITVS